MGSIQSTTDTTIQMNQIHRPPMDSRSSGRSTLTEVCSTEVNSPSIDGSSVLTSDMTHDGGRNVSITSESISSEIQLIVEDIANEIEDHIRYLNQHEDNATSSTNLRNDTINDLKKKLDESINEIESMLQESIHVFDANRVANYFMTLSDLFLIEDIDNSESFISIDKSRVLISERGYPINYNYNKTIQDINIDGTKSRLIHKQDNYLSRVQDDLIPCFKQAIDSRFDNDPNFSTSYGKTLINSLENYISDHPTFSKSSAISNDFIWLKNELDSYIRRKVVTKNNQINFSDRRSWIIRNYNIGIFILGVAGTLAVFGGGTMLRHLTTEGSERDNNTFLKIGGSVLGTAVILAAIGMRLINIHHSSAKKTRNNQIIEE